MRIKLHTSLFLLPAFLFLSACQSAHLLGYEVYNATSQPVYVGSANTDWYSHELAPGDTMELNVFIGPGKLRDAYLYDSTYRLEVEKSIREINPCFASPFDYSWRFKKLGLGKGRSTLIISPDGKGDSKSSASR